MSGTGLPILISKNCVRASQNASRFSGARKGNVWLASHSRVSLHHQQHLGFMFTSHNHINNVLNKSFSTGCGTLQNSLRLLGGQRAIKLQKSSCQKSCCKLSWNLSSSSSCLSSLHQNKGLVRGLVGTRNLSSKDTTSDEPNSKSEVQKREKSSVKEEPYVVKVMKLSKESDKVAAAKTTEVELFKADKKTELEVKPYRLRRKKVDFSKKHTDNITITALRAMQEFALKTSDIQQLRQLTRRTPYDTNPNEPPLQVYLRRDVEEKAMEVYGSVEALQREKKARKNLDRMLKSQYYLQRTAQDSDAYFGPKKEIKEYQTQTFLESPGARVVLSAICINAANFVLKVIGWAYSGSASMFSEAIHSLADTLNQCILAWGIHSAAKRPSKDHPYGYATMTYVSSLISGVAIFCVGAGLSFYHGIMGILHPEAIESLYYSFGILAGSFISEGATLYIATDAIKKAAAVKNIPFFEYVWRSNNPSVNVVFLEDAAAVVGVVVAASCMGLTSLTGNPIYDSMGSIAIGGILASVSAFLIYTNTESLIGRSIPEDQLAKINEMLVNDPVVRGVYDIKATDMGVGLVRFKAEIDFDGREVTRAYLDTIDPDALLEKVKTVQTPEDLETFMLTHGEKGIDVLGSQVDRLEKQIKKLNPEVRHVDLEIL